ncbi:MAG TPA: type IV pilus twitching motility protein PilT [Blastocatellia bacterium]|nr:type IV pilus twitching motility protein PilT [Blastocatellia bacterium]
MIESIDNLLVILHHQKGQELRFEVGQRARLYTPTGAYDISNTPLSQMEIGNAIGPIVPETVRRVLPTEPAVDFDYDCGEAGTFKVSITKPNGGLCVSLRPATNGSSVPVSAAGQPWMQAQPQTQAQPQPQAPAAAVEQPWAAPPQAPPPPQQEEHWRSSDASFGAVHEPWIQPPAAPVPPPPPGYAPPPAVAHQPQPEPQPAVAGALTMTDLFHAMFSVGASDLHLSVSKPPMMRKDGQMTVLSPAHSVITPEEAKRLLTSIMPAKSIEEFQRRNDTDFAYEIQGLARFRCNVFMDRKGMGGVFRVIPNEILTAEKLGLSQFILSLCKLNKGLVLVTGPTGSGKSTTLCAMVDYVNRNREDHIITIEDPIEFVHENKKCLINQREVHNHTDSFKDALRAALREDPDILLVGEMRDLETVAIAIETAETGHLVFGTLHTTTAASTVDRIIDQFPPDRQTQIRIMLSESLRGVISQTLLRKKNGGRIAALEVLIVTPAISNLIREGKTFQIPSSMQTGRALGMVTLNDAMIELVKAGTVAPEEAYKKAVDKSGFEALLKRNNIDIKFTLSGS